MEGERCEVKFDSNNAELQMQKQDFDLNSIRAYLPHCYTTHFWEYLSKQLWLMTWV
jgi:hypothetical protein